jgi:membrane protease YdiL (CAAX protease family)
MAEMKFNLNNEIKDLAEIVRSLDKKVLVILLSIAVIQTISWYYTSRLFFRQNYFDLLGTNPNYNYYEFAFWFVGDFISLFVIPFLIIKIILKEKIKNYGISIGDYKTGLKLTVIFLLIMIPIIWFVSSEPIFAATYPLLVNARDSWSIFFLYECGLLFYLFAWEFIWRGFMLFGLKEKFGYYAVIIQMIPFVILHDGKAPVEVFGAILGGIALGILAYRTKSIYYCVITHAGIMFSIDFISTLRYRASEFGTGLNSLIHILKQII